MKIILLFTGKTNKGYVSDGLSDYFERIKRYFNAEIIETQDIKKIELPQKQTEAEAEKILKFIEPTDCVCLLDETGTNFTSRLFAEFLDKKINAQYKRIVFIIAGPYGANTAVKTRANALISLSKMTFPHQLVRLIFAEQLYRACTILKNEPYHHD